MNSGPQTFSTQVRMAAQGAQLLRSAHHLRSHRHVVSSLDTHFQK